MDFKEITLEELLNEKKYKSFSYKELWHVVGNKLRHDDFGRLDGKTTESKTKILFDKWRGL